MTCECWALGAPVIYLCTHRSQSLISSSLRSELCGSVAQSSTEPGTSAVLELHKQTEGKGWKEIFAPTYCPEPEKPGLLFFWRDY